MVISKMASVGVCRTWCRLMYIKEAKGTVPCTLIRSFASTSAKRTEGVFHQVKKFVFGEEEPLDPSEIRGEESYYQLSTQPVPPVYSMTSSDIKTTVERISNEVAHDTQDLTFSDSVLKFKILSKCYEEFGLLVPNWQLKHITDVNSLLQFYVSAQPEDTRTFKSIDLDQLPPNLTIGGRVPRKEL